MKALSSLSFAKGKNLVFNMFIMRNWSNRCQILRRYQICLLVLSWSYRLHSKWQPVWEVYVVLPALIIISLRKTRSRSCRNYWGSFEVRTFLTRGVVVWVKVHNNFKWVLEDTSHNFPLLFYVSKMFVHPKNIQTSENQDYDFSCVWISHEVVL